MKTPLHIEKTTVNNIIDHMSNNWIAINCTINEHMKHTDRNRSYKNTPYDGTWPWKSHSMVHFGMALLNEFILQYICSCYAAVEKFDDV